MSTVEIIVLVVSISSIALIILMLVLFFKVLKTPKKEDSSELKVKIDYLSNNIPLVISNSVNKEMNAALLNLNNQNEMNNAKLERFQSSINESIDKKFGSLNEQVDKKLTEINKIVNERIDTGFKSTNETVKDVTERLARIDEAQKNIEALSNDVVSLKNVLENNQSRGKYGEFQLSMILHSVFGDTINTYEEQYVLKKGKTEEGDVRPDAVVFLPEPNKLICIDSKFPFQDYRRLLEEKENKSDKEILELKSSFRAAVKKHILTIRDKYIIAGKTAPQALMFVPNDGVFAYIHVELYDLVEEAQKNNVIITSPSTLQAILVTLNMLRINAERSKNLDKISDELRKLAKDYDKFGTEWERFSKGLDSAVKNKDAFDKRVGRISSKFTGIKTNDFEMIEEKTIEEIDDEEL